MLEDWRLKFLPAHCALSVRKRKQRKFQNWWMTKLLHPINQDNFIFLLTWATSRVGCSFLADTYIFRAGSAKNGCSIVEERLLSAIKEDGAKVPRKKKQNINASTATILGALKIHQITKNKCWIFHLFDMSVILGFW